jgi:polysaccharide chain length determinant protein (PEP-CTERM system associated)
MSEEQRKARILEILDDLRRSWWTVVAGVGLGLGAALVALHYIPKVYEAKTSIYLAPPKIPKEFEESSLVDDLEQRLWKFSEAVISREYMEALILREFDAPADDREMDQMVRRVRSRVSVSVNRKTKLFELKYQDANRINAARIANALADLYIEQNVQSRSNQAGEITRIMEERAQAAQDELDAQRRRIDRFKFENRFQLGEYLDTNWKKLDGAKADLLRNRESFDEKEAQLQRLRLRQQQSDALAGDDVLDAAAALDPWTARYRQLQGELEQLRVSYSEQHPSVKKKQLEIDTWLAQRPAEVSAPGDDGETATPVTPLMAEIDKLEREIQALERQRETIEAEIALAERRIDATPETDQRLAELMTGFDVVEKRHEDLQRKVEEARSDQWLEETKQGQQLKIAHVAEPPTMPVRPKPLLIQLIGIAAGLLLFVGPNLARQLLSPVFSSETSLQTITGLPVLASIPRIRTAQMIGADRRRHAKNIGLSLVTVAVVVAVFMFWG